MYGLSEEGADVIEQPEGIFGGWEVIGESEGEGELYAIETEDVFKFGARDGSERACFSALSVVSLQSFEGSAARGRMTHEAVDEKLGDERGSFCAI